MSSFEEESEIVNELVICSIIIQNKILVTFKLYSYKKQESKSGRLKLSFEEIKNGNIFNNDENLARLITENNKLKHRLNILKKVKFIVLFLYL